MLFHVVNYSYHSSVEPYDNIEDCLDALCRERCPASRAVELYQKLKSLKQDNFYLINDYYHEVVETVIQLSVAKRWGKAETTNRIEEAFLCGLNSTTEVEMAKFQAFTCQDIRNRVGDVESRHHLQRSFK